MNHDFLFALYVFCCDYHSGQWSRLYRLQCRLSTHYRIRLSDSAWAAIRHGRADRGNEWEQARIYYRQLKQSKYAKETK